MKILTFLFILIILSPNILSQSADLRKLVETEIAFAVSSEKNGTNAAFLEFLAEDGIVFRPEAKNGKEFFRERPKSDELLAWQPKFADMSANSMIGFTTGDWQYSKVKGEAPIAFGQYVSVWQKQTNGEFKLILDIGISHDKPKDLDSKWTFPNGQAETPTKFSTFITAESVYDRSQFKSMFENIYKKHFADDVRVLRDGQMPILGKKNALSILKKEVSLNHFPKLKLTFGNGDFAYGFGTYVSPTEKGNFVQIWKFRNGKWQIILDILTK